MVVRDYETGLLAELDEALGRIRARRSSLTGDVRRDLSEGLRLLVEASFEQRSADYVADVARMNEDPAWIADEVYHQSAAVPPKYFGGDPASIVPGEYVLHVSLNHRLLGNLAYPEYVALRRAAVHYETCAGFFRGAYYYEESEFFPARAKVLRSWARDRPDLAKLCDREILARTSLFIERYPTWSSESTPPARPMEDLYCLVLNDRARAFILAVAPPAVILLAGNEGAAALNEYRVRENGAPRPWRGARVPKTPPAKRAKRFKVARNVLTLSGSEVSVLRCGFLKTASGINSGEDMRVLGRLLAGDPFNPEWPLTTSHS